MMESLLKCMRVGPIRLVALPLLWGVMGCGTSGDGVPTGGTGGGTGQRHDSAVGSGGTSSAGGTSGQGGTASSAGGQSGGAGAGGRTGGAGGQFSGGGGTAGVGGSSATGGSAGNGGTNGTGGAVATGGISVTGGIAATGGTSGSGGARTDGGVAGTGGTAGPDASTGTGGKGGTTSTGGVGGKGGTTGNGGAAGTGGATTLAATPPMGWNSWNTFNCSPSDSLIRGMADAMVSSGMAAAGYVYVNIDDCWMNGRDASGNLRPDATKFPNGISAVADYIHGKGLKLGIYEVPAAVTCAGRGSFGSTAGVGSLGHETADAKSFASWGVDYLKYDYCWGDMKGFKVMKDALVATGRPIFYSINPASGTGASCVPPNCSIDLVSIANMWRIGFDISASWSSVLSCIDLDKPLSKYAAPGHWNDPDMLEVGKGMSADEDRSHFGLWAMLAAPLLTGNDLRSMNATTKTILTNADVIAVDQDPLGMQATVVATPGTNLEIWSKSLSGTNTRAVALFNRSAAAASMTVQWSALGLPAGAATVRDLWNQKDLGSSTDSYTATSVPSHGIVMLKVTSAP